MADAVDSSPCSRLVAGQPRRARTTVLGPHVHDGGVTIRTLRPLAKSVTRRQRQATRTAMTHEHEGIWVAALDAARGDRLPARGRVRGVTAKPVDDPYRYLPNARRDRPAPDQRGPPRAAVGGARRARARYEASAGDVTGTSFAVWAPNAQGVRVVGDFNYWDGRAHPMRVLGSPASGSCSSPGVGSGTLYKFEVLGADGCGGRRPTRSRPYARCRRERASVVYESGYAWTDAEWLASRGQSARPRSR